MEDRGDGRREEQRGARRPRREEEDGPDRGRDDAEEEEEGGGRRAVRPRLAPPQQAPPPPARNQERNEADSDGGEDDEEDEDDDDGNEEVEENDEEEEDDDVEQVEELFSEGVEDGEYDTDWASVLDGAFDERGGALVHQLLGIDRRNASPEEILLELSVEGTVDLVRRYGGGGSVLWQRVLDRPRDFKALFQWCCETFLPEQVAELLRRLVSFLPNLLSRRDDASEHRYRGVTLLHLAVRAGAPLETIRVIAGMDSGALLLRDRRGRRPVHDACDRYYGQDLALPRIIAVLDASRDVVRTRTRRGELPLHLAAEYLMTGGPPALETIQWLVDAYPEALNSRTRLGQTPIMIAIQHAEWLTPPASQALEMLLNMIKLAPGSLRTPEGSYALTALQMACGRCPYMELVAPITVASPAALSDPGSSSKALPLHKACSQLLQTDGSEHLWEVIRFLMNAYPDALWARDSRGMTPIMAALQCDPGPGLRYHQSVKLLPLLLDMIRRGGSRSLWGERSDWRWNGPRDGRPRAARTAVELACGSLQYPFDLEVVSPLMEAHPAALCVCLLRDDIVAVDDTVYPMVEGLSPQQARQQHFRELRRERHVPVWRAEVADAVATGARAAFLAAADVLIHETTLGMVPDPIRARVRQILGRQVPPDVASNGSSHALLRSVRDRVRGDALWRLRSDVLDDADLQSFLQSSQVFQDLISGVYRMNKAGRLGGLGGQIGGSEVDGEAAAAAAGSRGDAAVERHARILAAAGDNLSCLFLRVRESPALFGIHGPSERTAAAAAAAAAVRSSPIAGAAD